MALDDMDLVWGRKGRRMIDHFVHTVSEVGLTDEGAAEAIRMLRGGMGDDN